MKVDNFTKIILTCIALLGLGNIIVSLRPTNVHAAGVRYVAEPIKRVSRFPGKPEEQWKAFNERLNQAAKSRELVGFVFADEGDYSGYTAIFKE